MTPAMDDPQLRREFRRFVLAHHPDRGGDPDTFRAGLTRYRSAAAIAEDDPRLRAPVVFQRNRRGPAAVIDRVRRARAARHRPPRVH